MLAAVFALMLQQTAPLPAATGQVVWETPTPVEAAQPVAAVDLPPIPDSARADPYGYERAECSPLIRSREETLEACQSRVRVILAGHLGAALQCGAPARADRPTAVLEERNCETRPRAQPQGGVAWTEECRPASGRREEDDGLKIRLGGRD